MPRSAAVPDDFEPVVDERCDRVITGIVTAFPVLSLFFVGWQLWASLLRWNDIFVFLLLYVLSGIGVTVGFHRLFTHRAFKTTRSVRAVLAILGSAAIEGPVIAWVADHRKHHAFSDREGDPHSPHVDHGQGLRGAVRGLFHAHVGWLFIHTHRGRRERYASDLRSITQGRGAFELEFDHYGEVPSNVAQRVITEHKKAVEEAHAH